MRARPRAAISAHKSMKKRPVAESGGRTRSGGSGRSGWERTVEQRRSQEEQLGAAVAGRAKAQEELVRERAERERLEREVEKGREVREGLRRDLANAHGAWEELNRVLDGVAWACRQRRVAGEVVEAKEREFLRRVLARIEDVVYGMSEEEGYTVEEVVAEELARP